MAHMIRHDKALSTSPLKVSAPLGAALAFMGMQGSLPLFHGSQGCTAFALVMMVRHFREAIPLQTTAMNEVSTILGGMDHVEEALLNIGKRAHPKVIGLISTALTETRGEDIGGDLALIRRRNPELSGVAVIPVSAPEFEGSFETGWGRAVTAIVQSLAERPVSRQPVKRVNLLPGCHLTSGDVETLKEIVADFGLEATVLPDLSESLDGHVPGVYVPTTLGGTSVEAVREMGRAEITIAIGEHMRPAAQALQDKGGVPFVVLDRVTGLEAVDRLMVCLSSSAGIPVPQKYRRQRSQLVDAMLDSHFFFSGQRIAIAAEPALLWTLGRLVTDMGATLSAAITTQTMPLLAELVAERVVVGDFLDLEDEVLESGGADLIIANANARQSAARLRTPLFRAGFPVFDRLGSAHQVMAGYRGTRDLVFALGNMLMETPHQRAASLHDDKTETTHGPAQASVG